VVLVFNVDHAPSVLSAANLLSVDNDVLLASDDGKGDDILAMLAIKQYRETSEYAYPDLNVHHTLLVIQLVIVVGVHLQVVESKFLLDPLFEFLSLFQGQGVRLGDHGDNVDNIGKLLEHDYVDWLKTNWGQYNN
jgi:hypothetical protein